MIKNCAKIIGCLIVYPAHQLLHIHKKKLNIELSKGKSKVGFNLASYKILWFLKWNEYSIP
jgi:hypothetical protein